MIRTSDRKGKLTRRTFLAAGAAAIAMPTVLRHSRAAAKALRVSTLGRKLKVLNLGCGPAIEIQRLIDRSPLCEAVDFTLLDFNDETIAYTRQILEGCRRAGHRPSTPELPR